MSSSPSNTPFVEVSQGQSSLSITISIIVVAVLIVCAVTMALLVYKRNHRPYEPIIVEVPPMDRIQSPQLIQLLNELQSTGVPTRDIDRIRDSMRFSWDLSFLPEEIEIEIPQDTLDRSESMASINSTSDPFRKSQSNATYPM
jgi:hypothetical protein